MFSSLAGTYPCNNILFKMGRHPSPACTLCCDVILSPSRMYSALWCALHSSMRV